MKRFVMAVCLALSCLLALGAAPSAEPSPQDQTAQVEAAQVSPEVSPEAPAEDTSNIPADESLTFSMGAEPDRLIDADSVLLIDRTTGTVLYEKNADERAYPASTTKILTALCVADAVPDLDGTTITVTQEALDLLPDDDISLADLEVGEELTVRQLLNCLLIPSGNDAAVVLGHYLGNGNINAFVERMNQVAAGLGCTGTHFVSVNGLSGEEHYTTARDMARMAEALLENPDLAEIVRTPYYYLTTNRRQDVELENTNHMLDPAHETYLPAITGVKTGSSDLSGRCIINSAEQDGMRFLSVIMGAPYRDSAGQVIEPSPAITEARKLYNWALTYFTRALVCRSDEDMTVTIEGVGEAEAHPGKTVAALMPAEQTASITSETQLASDLRKPLKAGQEVGQVVYRCGDTVLASVPLVLSHDISGLRWWLLPLPIAAVLAVLSLALRRFLPERPAKARREKAAPTRRGGEKAAPRRHERPAREDGAPARRRARSPEPEEDDEEEESILARKRVLLETDDEPGGRRSRRRRREEEERSPFVDYSYEEPKYGRTRRR